MAKNSNFKGQNRAAAAVTRNKARNAAYSGPNIQKNSASYNPDTSADYLRWQANADRDRAPAGTENGWAGPGRGN